MMSNAVGITHWLRDFDVENGSGKLCLHHRYLASAQPRIAPIDDEQPQTEATYTQVCGKR